RSSPASRSRLHCDSARKAVYIPSRKIAPRRTTSRVWPWSDPGSDQGQTLAGTAAILAPMAAIEGTTTLVGLLGDPVSGSLSPRMQNAAFAARGLDWAYVPLPVDHAALGDAVAGLAALGFAGANVTTPHKAGVIPFCHELDESAERAGSVNTLVVREGRI